MTGKAIAKKLVTKQNEIGDCSDAYLLPPNPVGQPNVCWHYKGKTYMFITKNENGVETKHDIIRSVKLEECGIPVYIVYTWEEAKERVAKILLNRKD